jgi:hypothetical protein
LDEDTRRLVAPDRSLASLKNTFAQFKAALLATPHESDPFDLAFSARFMITVAEGCPRPAYRCSEARRLLGLLWTMHNQPHKLLSRVHGELIKTRTTEAPKRRKALVDTHKVIDHLAARDPPSSFLELRDLCIALYLLASARRPSNAAAARVPANDEIWPGRAILFREFGAKNDSARTGNCLLIDSASSPAVDPVRWFEAYLTHPEFVRLRDSFREENPLVPFDLTPLFLYRPNKGRFSNQTRQLSAERCSTIVRALLKQAGADRDPTGRKVCPRFIRRTQLSRMRLAGIPEVIIKTVGAWTISDVSDRHYFSDDGRPIGLTNFLFHLDETPSITVQSDPAEAVNNWLTPAALASVGPCSLGSPTLFSGQSLSEAHISDDELVTSSVQIERTRD